LKSMAAVQLTEALNTLKLISYFDAAASTMFVYDYFLTLGMEIDLVWTGRWTFMKVLYIAQRYMPFIDSVLLVLYREHLQNPTSRQCRSLIMASDWLMVIGIGFSEIILTTRVWAVWNRSPKVAVLLSALFLLSWIPQFVFFELFHESLQFSDFPAPPQIGGCLVVHANSLLLVSWIILMVFDGRMYFALATWHR